ncbi:MAG: HAD family hydrolase [Candidatus Krumholzibacteriia bacterium]
MGKFKGRRAAAFIFDLDGTLVDSGLDIARSANFVRAHFGLPELPVQTAQRYVGDGVVNLVKRMLGHDVRSGMTGDAGLPVSPEKLEEGLGVFRDHYGRHLLDNTRLYPGVLDVLMHFRSFPLLLATNKPRLFTDQILQGLNIKDAFRNVVAGDETPAIKPDPGHLRQLTAGLGVPAAEIVVVGDSPNDINAAREFGAVSVGCMYGLTAPGLIRAAGPDLVIDGIGELVDLFPSR